jgi:DNA-binding CsgD family transcriptional regulator
MALPNGVRVSTSQDGQEFLVHIPVQNALDILLGYKPTKSFTPVLSRRQQQVFDLVKQGKADKEIAVALNISVRGVKFHVSGLLKKFGIKSRLQLIKNYGIPDGEGLAAVLAGKIVWHDVLISASASTSDASPS